MKLFLISCLSILISSHLYAQAQDNEVVRLEKQRFAAMINKDTSFLKNVLADDLLYIHADGREDGKKSFINAIANKDLDYKQMDLKNITSRIYKNTVILSGNMHIIVYSKKANKTLDLNIHYMDVYQKRHNKWQLVSWQSSKLD
jgi:ketosteroid isomerase-like protein